MKEIPVIAFARREIGRPFEWGETDCASLIIRCFRETGGPDIASITWTDEKSARERMAISPPTESLERAGFRRVHPRDATVGDILVASTEAWNECLHLVIGTMVLSAIPEHGVVALPLRRAAAASSMGWAL